MSRILSKKTWLLIALLSILAPVFIYGEVALSNNGSYNFQEQSGLNISAEEAGFETKEVASSLDDIVANAIFAVLSLVAIIFFAFILWAGFKWMTSQGNKDVVDKSQNTIKNAVIGLLITLAAYMVTYYVVNVFYSGSF